MLVAFVALGVMVLFLTFLVVVMIDATADAEKRAKKAQDTADDLRHVMTVSETGRLRLVSEVKRLEEERAAIVNERDKAWKLIVEYQVDLARKVQILNTAKRALEGK